MHIGRPDLTPWLMVYICNMLTATLDYEKRWGGVIDDNGKIGLCNELMIFQISLPT